MQNTIKKALEMLFHSQPFSRENEEFRETLSLLAVQKYEHSLSEGLSPAQAAGNLLIHFDTVENAVSCLEAEAPAHSSDTALDAGAVSEENTFRKIQKKLWRRSCDFSLLLALFFNCCLSLILNLSVSFPSIAFIEWNLFGILVFLTAGKRRHTIKQYNFLLPLLHLHAEA